MSHKHSKSKIMHLATKHRLPPSLIGYRLMMGFPMPCIGATDLEGVTYFNREFMQQPFTDKKPIKTAVTKSHPPHYTPASSEDYGHIKVTRKKKHRF